MASHPTTSSSPAGSLVGPQEAVLMRGLTHRSRPATRFLAVLISSA